MGQSVPIGSRGYHAVRAMVDLARCYEAGRPDPLAAIAERQNISVSYLEQLFARLRRQRLLTAMRGPGGGYRLSRPPRETRIDEIVRAVDGAMATAESGEGLPAGQEEWEAARASDDLWTAVGQEVSQYLSRVSLQDVIRDNGALV